MLSRSYCITQRYAADAIIDTPPFIMLPLFQLSHFLLPSCLLQLLLLHKEVFSMKSLFINSRGLGSLLSFLLFLHSSFQPLRLMFSPPVSSEEASSLEDKLI